MNRAEFTRAFAELLELAPEDLKPETPLGASERWDSVTYLSAIVLIDESLGVAIRPEVVSRAQTFGDILRAVESALQG